MEVEEEFVDSTTQQAVFGYGDKESYLFFSCFLLSTHKMGKKL